MEGGKLAESEGSCDVFLEGAKHRGRCLLVASECQLEPGGGSSFPQRVLQVLAGWDIVGSKLVQGPAYALSRLGSELNRPISSRCASSNSCPIRTKAIAEESLNQQTTVSEVLLDLARCVFGSLCGFMPR